MHQWTIRAAQVALVAAAFSAAGAGVAGATTDPDPAYAPQMDICGNAIANSGGVGTATCKGQAKIGDDDDAAPVAPAMHAWSAKPETVMPSIGAPNAGVGAAGEPVTTSAAPAAKAPITKAPITKAPVEKAPTAKAPEKAPVAKAPAVAPATAPAKAMAPSATQAEAPSMPPSITQAEAPSMPPSITQAEAPSMPPSAVQAEAPEQLPPAAPEIAPPTTAMQASVAEPAPEMMTSGENGLLSGNQVKAPVRIPIRICGNAGALGGMATASCEGTASSGHFAGMHHAYRIAGLLG